VAEVDVKWATEQSALNGSYIIDFRRSDSINYYRYGVNWPGSIYWFGATVNGEWTSLGSSSSFNAVRKGTSMNRMKVSCEGSTLKCYMNDILLTTLSDSKLQKGKIALGVGKYAYEYTDPEAVFDNLRVSAP
jgi:hypothetical protein